MSIRLWWKYNAMWRIRRRGEKVLLGIVWRLPRPIVYWCVIRLFVTVTKGHENPMSVSLDEALKRFETA